MGAETKAVDAARAAGLSLLHANDDESIGALKRPRPLGQWEWKRFQTERPTDDEHRRMFANGEANSFGAVTGAVSGNVEVVDIEGRCEGGYDRLVDHPTAGPIVEKITAGYCEATPSGGLHLLYRCEHVEGRQELATRRSDGATLIEILGESNFCVLAPTPGYEILSGGYDQITTITPDERRILHDAIRELDERPEPRPEPPPAKPRERAPGTSPLEDYDNRVTCDEVLLDAGFTFHHADRGGRHYTRPGKDARKGSSVTVWDDDMTCTPWSTSIDAPAEYLTGKRKLRSSQVYAALRHGGDYADATKALADAGYGDRVDLLAWAYRNGSTPPEGVDPTTGEILPDLWEMRPVLAHIRQAAHARLMSPDAVLGAVLARAAALIPVGYRLPGIVGAASCPNLFVMLTGPSGVGKTASTGVAHDLVPTDVEIDSVGLGSAEGIIEIYMDLVKVTGDGGQIEHVRRQVAQQALIVVDEATIVSELAGRKGSTLLSVLRSAWSGSHLSTANATKDRWRHLDRLSYRLCLIAGIQPANAAEILDDAAGGLPQRFLWFAAADPDIPDDPPDWPGPIDWDPPVRITVPQTIDVDPTIAADIRRRHLARQRGDDVGGLDAHGDLSCLKVAAVFAALDGRPLKINVDDWEIAQTIHRRSIATRTHVAAVIAHEQKRRNAEANRRAADRAVTVDAAVETSAERRALQSMAKSMANRVHRHGPQKLRDLQAATDSRHRGLVDFDDAIAVAEAEGWIVRDGDEWVAGGSRPS